MNAGPVFQGPPEARSWYEGCRTVLATRHGKEQVVAPALETATGMRVEVPAELNTDVLGTFSGERERRGTMRDAAVAKARMGMKVSGLPRGLASEGSYGPHPFVPFIRGGLELMVLVDDDWQMVVVEQLVVERPRFGHLEVTGPGLSPELDAFLDRMGFPDHGMVVSPASTEDRGRPGRRGSGSGAPVAKGIHDTRELQAAVELACARSPEGRAWVEVDMRAHHNPTRMRSIGQLAGIMAERLLTLCRLCGCPGYGLARRPRGLPCRSCGTATAMFAGEIYGCPVCAYEEHQPRWDGLVAADPMHCPTCNP